eukprot:scaffold4902_cov115-Cylindrotheca_fusiformis.AAC.6
MATIIVSHNKQRTKCRKNRTIVCVGGLVALLSLLYNTTIYGHHRHHRTELESIYFDAMHRSTLVSMNQLSDSLRKALSEGRPLNRREKDEFDAEEMKNYKDLRGQGYTEIDNTKESVLLRQYRLRNMKVRGIFRGSRISLAEGLFPGIWPENYHPDSEAIYIYTDRIGSKKTLMTLDTSQIPGYKHLLAKSSRLSRNNSSKRSNLGSMLLEPAVRPVASFQLPVKRDVPCTVFGDAIIQGGEELQWLRALVKNQYKVHLRLDGLPALVKYWEFNAAVRGYPVGFKTTQEEGSESKLFLVNHLKFTITYQEDPSEFEGLRITGFDILPVSIRHDDDTSTKEGIVSSCQGFDGRNDDPSKFVYLDIPDGDSRGMIPVTFSYDVQWIQGNEQKWADRWDVYFVNDVAADAASDSYDSSRYSFMQTTNSLLLILILTAAVANALVRTLCWKTFKPKDLIQDNLAEEEDTKGWRAIQGDVFRPPICSPLALSVLVGTGTQLGTTMTLSIIMIWFGYVQILQRGQFLTWFLGLYALCGPIGGYVSARIYTFQNPCKRWKMAAFATQCPTKSMPFGIAAVSFWALLKLFLLWLLVFEPLVYLGASVSSKMPPVQVPSSASNKTDNEDGPPREIPKSRRKACQPFILMVGGIVPLPKLIAIGGSVMRFMWKDVWFYLKGEDLLVAALMSCLACAEMSIIQNYTLLWAEDHRWWWKSFWNGASTVWSFRGYIVSRNIPVLHGHHFTLLWIGVWGTCLPHQLLLHQGTLPGSTSRMVAIGRNKRFRSS